MMTRWLWIIIGAVLAALISLSFLYPHQMVSPGNVIPAHAKLERDCFACHKPFRGVSSTKCIVCHKAADIGRITTGGKAVPQSGKLPPFHQHLTEQNCMACHSDHPAPALTKRPVKPFDHSLIATPMQTKCQTCHVAPKDEMHSGLRLPCAQCHQNKAWKPATFDHSRFFALKGEHDVACITCHIGQNYSRYTCYGCHEHARNRVIEEHLEEGIRNIDDCVRCHRNAHDKPEHGEDSREGEDDR